MNRGGNNVKITFEIPDEEIKQAVFELLTRRLADEIFTDRWNYDERAYRRMLKDGVNAVLKERADEIIDRCIPQAAEYIGKKGVKKFVDSLGKET